MASIIFSFLLYSNPRAPLRSCVYRRHERYNSRLLILHFTSLGLVVMNKQTHSLKRVITHYNTYHMETRVMPKSGHGDKWFSILVLGTPCPACFRYVPAPTHLIQINGPDNDPFIWIRCVWGGKRPEDQDWDNWLRPVYSSWRYIAVESVAYCIYRIQVIILRKIFKGDNQLWCTLRWMRWILTIWYLLCNTS